MKGLSRHLYTIFNNLVDLAITAVIAIALAIGCFSIFVDYKKTQNLKVGYSGYTMKDLGAVAWLSVKHTDIDFPVMQGKDDSEYLNKNPLGQMDLSGSIFLESRSNPKLTDPYSIIYGHHIDGELMFGTLDAFKKSSYLKSHQEGEIDINDGPKYTLYLFACATISSENQTVFDCASQKNTKALRAYIDAHDPDHLTYDSSLRIVALSTCVNATSENRVVVFGTIK